MAALWIFVALGYLLLYAFASEQSLPAHSFQLKQPVRMERGFLPGATYGIANDGKIAVGTSHL